MRIEHVYPCVELQRMCREMDAPVYINHHGRSGKLYFARRPSCSVEDVERFFASVTNRERTVNEQSTNNERSVL